MQTPTLSGRDPIRMDVTYPAPVIEDIHLGGTPKDYIDTTPTVTAEFVSCANNACGMLPNEVYRKLPLMNPDGTPQLRDVTAHFDESPTSKLEGFALGGAIGATVGGVIGLIAGSILGAPWIGTAVGAAVGAVPSGIGGAAYASHDNVKLVWDVVPIKNETYIGYRETVKEIYLPAGQSRYQHKFAPVLETQEVGYYKKPHVEHYRA